MLTCINCNRSTVARDGDTFTCRSCGYTWDVAHEQANARYLETQGRTPTPAMAEAEQSLEAALGLDLPARTPDLPELPTVPAVEEPEPIDVPLREPHLPTGEERARIEAILDSRTVAELEDVAADAGIDLAGARLKADKITVLVDSGRIYLADDQHTVVIVSED